jgi:hypothetical protein
MNMKDNVKDNLLNGTIVLVTGAMILVMTVVIIFNKLIAAHEYSILSNSTISSGDGVNAANSLIPSYIINNPIFAN